MSRVRLPVDRLEELWPFADPRLRVGALLHGASADSALRPTLDILAGLDGRLFRLAALFGPQHGFGGTTQDNMIEWQSGRHPRLGLPLHSLYGEHREPTPDMLDGLDVLFVDLVDVGARYYTFIWTLFLCLRACERAGIHVVVADRPNPINGVTVEGEPQRPDHLSFVGLDPLPVRHGRTIGELARHFRDLHFPDCRLTVLPLEGWQREHWLDETGLPFLMPSPNMPTLDTATVYPGMCLLEGTNLSEGRGTTRPFELFGAPWIDGHDLARRLNALDLPGVVFREVMFEPTFQKHARQPCGGCQLHVVDRDVFAPYQTAIAILDTVRARWPESFAWKQPPYEYEFHKLPIEILTGRPLADSFPPLPPAAAHAE
jgi:uncharacterized protein YbbC (DUF1343 family)